MRSRFQAVSLLVIMVIFYSSIGNVQGASVWAESDNIQRGPYVDEVIFKVIANQDQRILQLLAGDIEMDNSFFDPVHLPVLDEDPNIDIFNCLRNGYGQIVINCRDYPLNISGLRRAFAFAFDKTRITNEILDGFSIEHDSFVPAVSSWCIEDELEWHYYTNQSDVGNQLLDDLGFNVSSTTGYRLAPNGEEFDIGFYAPSGHSHLIGQIALDALHSLHINADWAYCEPSVLGHHGDYDMAFYTQYFYDDDVEWLGYEFWSEYANVEGENPTNFSNETYDLWRNQLLHATTYEAVYEAAAEMQEILHYNVPGLVIYENIYMQAYRNDEFTGYIEDHIRHISGLWTLRKIHKIDGSFDASVSIGIGQDPDSFNFFTQASVYSREILDNLLPSLYTYGPDMLPVPNLAETMVVETHQDNSAVPQGHTRFTFDIIQNATWSDGTPLTAEDVAFTFNYDLERSYYTELPIPSINNLVAAYAPNLYRVVLEFSSESYWYFNKFGYSYIIPEHVFNNETGIGYEDWLDWNPFYEPSEPDVHCGPFTFSDIEAGEYYTIRRNQDFYYAVNQNDSSGSANSTTLTNNSSTTGTLNLYNILNISIGTGAAVVIVYCGTSIIRKRRNESTT